MSPARYAVAAIARAVRARLTRPVPQPRDRRPDTTVVAHENGPLLLRGRFTLLTQDGAVIDPRRATVALCRCGHSARKPFCDGTHRTIGFHAPSSPG